MKPTIVLAAMLAAAVAAGCQTLAAMDYEDAARAIRAGAAGVTVAPEPDRAFARADGSTCQEYRYYEPGMDGLARQGLAVVCRHPGQDWLLVSRVLDPVKRDRPPRGDKNGGTGGGTGSDGPGTSGWKPVTGR